MGKYLEALKLLYGDDEKNCETPKARTDKTDRSPFVSNVSSSSGGFNEISPENEQESIPFTDHEIAEYKINGLTLREDRAFVRQMLLGAYGNNRLTLVDQYLSEWHIGATAEVVEVKKENAGRHRANTWLREKQSKHG